jgi:hypothetical protein
MMDWKGALRARLIADATVLAAVGQRVYWVDRPQLSALPAITLQTVIEIRPQTMTGFDGLDRSMVQIDVWGESDLSVYNIKEAVIAAVIGASNANGIKFERAFIDVIRDLGEQFETRFIHRASMDVIFYHSTTA